MAEQLELPPPPRTTKWAEAYRKWIAENPQVLELADVVAREAVALSKRLSSGTIVEQIRWRAPRTWSKDAQGFKINQNFGAYLIRDVVRRNPDLGPLVEFRELRS